MVDEFLASHPPLPIRTYLGKTPEIIAVSEATLSVSGSVALELLYRLKPSCIFYRIGKLDLAVCNYFKKSRFICLVNMLADKELYPEFLTDRDESQNLANHALRWLNDEAAFAEAKRDLAELKAPGKVRLSRYGTMAHIGEGRCFPRIGTAVDGYIAISGASWVDWEDAQRAAAAREQQRPSG